MKNYVNVKNTVFVFMDHMFKECSLCSFVLGTSRQWGIRHSPSLHILSVLTGKGDQYQDNLYNYLVN